MKKGLFAGLAGLAGLATAVCLAPFELKADTEGNFTYKSVLVGVTRKKDGDAPATYELSFLNRPPLNEISGKIQTATKKTLKTVRNVIVPQETEIVFESEESETEAEPSNAEPSDAEPSEEA